MDSLLFLQTSTGLINLHEIESLSFWGEPPQCGIRLRSGLTVCIFDPMTVAALRFWVDEVQSMSVDVKKLYERRDAIRAERAKWEENYGPKDFVAA